MRIIIYFFFYDVYIFDPLDSSCNFTSPCTLILFLFASRFHPIRDYTRAPKKKKEEKKTEKKNRDSFVRYEKKNKWKNSKLKKAGPFFLFFSLLFLEILAKRRKLVIDTQIEPGNDPSNVHSFPLPPLSAMDAVPTTTKTLKESGILVGTSMIIGVSLCVLPSRCNVERIAPALNGNAT